jgi:hypothetical protein
MKKNNPRNQVAVAVTGAAAVASLLALGATTADTAPPKGQIEAGHRIQHGGVWGGG